MIKETLSVNADRRDNTASDKHQTKGCLRIQHPYLPSVFG